ncbi:LppU/SCO3897 family protein [Streptomyces sp. NPDC002446]
MSAPPPYQNQPPQQPYGYPPQQPYGQQQPQQPYGQQPPQPHAYPQQRGGQQRPPQRSPLRGLITAVVVLAVFGGVGWYVWNYNTDPNGGKAKAEASASARAKEAEKHNPDVGDCVKVQDPNGTPVPTIVDCSSAEAEYKMVERLYGAGQECGQNGKRADYGIDYSGRRRSGGSYTLCFTKV